MWSNRICLESLQKGRSKTMESPKRENWEVCKMAVRVSYVTTEVFFFQCGAAGTDGKRRLYGRVVAKKETDLNPNFPIWKQEYVLGPDSNKTRQGRSTAIKIRDGSHNFPSQNIDESADQTDRDGQELTWTSPIERDES
jgi:hypothetical protein